MESCDKFYEIFCQSSNKKHIHIDALKLFVFKHILHHWLCLLESGPVIFWGFWLILAKTNNLSDLILEIRNHPVQLSVNFHKLTYNISLKNKSDLNTYMLSLFCNRLLKAKTFENIL